MLPRSPLGYPTIPLGSLYKKLILLCDELHPPRATLTHPHSIARLGEILHIQNAATSGYARAIVTSMRLFGLCATSTPQTAHVTPLGLLIATTPLPSTQLHPLLLQSAFAPPAFSYLAEHFGHHPYPLPTPQQLSTALRQAGFSSPGAMTTASTVYRNTLRFLAYAIPDRPHPGLTASRDRVTLTYPAEFTPEQTLAVVQKLLMQAHSNNLSTL